MNHPIKKSLATNKVLKLVSLTLGICVWALLSQYHTNSEWVEIPVCFYNVPENLKISSSQETIRIQLRGKQADLRQCETMGLHIDATDFKAGQQRICPTQQQLFLPQSVKLVHSKPLYLEITATVI